QDLDGPTTCVLALLVSPPDDVGMRQAGEVLRFGVPVSQVPPDGDGLVPCGDGVVQPRQMTLPGVLGQQPCAFRRRHVRSEAQRARELRRGFAMGATAEARRAASGAYA